MKEDRDYNDETLFPNTWKLIYTPVLRTFANDTITYIGVLIGKFLYPPFPIKDVIGKAKSISDPVPNFLNLLCGFILFLAAFFGIVFAIYRCIEIRRKKQLMGYVHLYLGENACSASHRLQNILPPELIYDENECCNNYVAPERLNIRNPVVEEIYRNHGIRVENQERRANLDIMVPEELAGQEQRPVVRAAIDEEPEMVANDPVDSSIVPCEPCERYVAPAELSETHVVPGDLNEGGQPKEPEKLACQSPGRKSPCTRKKVTFDLPSDQPRKQVVRQPNTTHQIARKVQGSISRK